MELAEIIQQRIAAEGPITFRDFMEMALYYPGSGYYNRTEDQIGGQGDFYTSSSLTAIFGAMIGRQLAEMWQLTGEGEFTIVEYGAGNGLLCRDILAYLKDNSPLYDVLHYAIIEKSTAMRSRQQSHLCRKVGWYDTIAQLGDITGCVLSNELIDNFAVHQVLMAEELQEVFVDHRDGFVEVLRPAEQELKDYLQNFHISLPKGYRTEINLEAGQWLAGAAAALKKGFILTIDYGYPAETYYHLNRSRGTLVCYHQHRVNEQPFLNIGRQDITAHVNFSALCRWGHEHGLACCGLTTQAHFLLSLGFHGYLRESCSAEADVLQAAIAQARLTHTLLVNMGTKFKVLIQQKGFDQRPMLSGLQIAYCQLSEARS
jgi:SAM-dependent MidA family methyltransferase